MTPATPTRPGNEAPPPAPASNGSAILARPPSWPNGTDGTVLDYIEGFDQWRGRPSTASWINVFWAPWDWMTAPGFRYTRGGTGPDNLKLWDELATWPQVAVLMMSMAGNRENDYPAYEEDMRQCAKGAFDEHWRTFAANAAKAGRTGQNTVVSLAHEFNGTWWAWNPSVVGIDTWVGCWRKVYTAIKSASDLRVTWVYTVSVATEKGGDYAVDSPWDAYPGDDYVDVIGVNRYDTNALGERSSTDWRDDCWNEQDLCRAAEFARAHGKTIGVPEWSVVRGQWGYGDNPFYIEKMKRFFVENADILAFEVIFNNRGEGEWYVYPEDKSNRASSARYRELWGAP